MPKLAIYPGSFDPVTNGHVDIIVRGRKIFDHIIICILNNPTKKALFTVDERIDMLNASLNGLKNVEIATYDGLLVDYAVQRKATRSFAECVRFPILNMNSRWPL